MPSVFNYLNYREFLDDYYKEQKSGFPYFSFKYFANKAGFASKSFLYSVIEGKKNLTEESTAMIQKVLKLSDRAFSYFCTLIAFNQAKTLEQKNMYFEQLMQYNRRSNATLILRQQYQFYSKWYYNTVRELLSFYDFRDDFALLGKMLKPQISAGQARAAIELLKKLGLIVKQDGRYVPAEKAITTGDEIRSLAVQNFHVQNLIIAAESLDTTPSQQRDISCVVGAISQKSFETIKQEIQQFRAKIAEIIDKDTEPERIYNITFLLFPTSQKKP
jgi:uncharacterized protein (TIGR02147 family)